MNDYLAHVYVSPWEILSNNIFIKQKFNISSIFVILLQFTLFRFWNWSTIIYLTLLEIQKKIYYSPGFIIEKTRTFQFNSYYKSLFNEIGMGIFKTVYQKSKHLPVLWNLFNNLVGAITLKSYLETDVNKCFIRLIKDTIVNSRLVSH